MIGYAYLDLDNNLVYKTARCIEEEYAHFWTQNIHLIIKYWKFDTEDKSSMLRMFRDISDRKVPVNKVKEFVECIGYDLSSLKNAN